MRRWILRGVALVVLAGAVYFVWPFFQSSEAQVEAQQRRLVHAVEKRQWSKVKELMDESYADQWKLRRDPALSFAHQLLGGFLIFHVEWKPQGTKVDGNNFQLQGTLKVTGTGAGASSMIVDRSAQIRQPWTFTWHKIGWGPKDWRLLSVSNPELEGIYFSE